MRNAAQIWHQCPRCSFWFDCLSEPSFTRRRDECPPEISEQTHLTEPSYTERPGASRPQPDTISPPTVNGESSFNMAGPSYTQRPGECPPETSEQTHLTERSYTEMPDDCQPQPDTISPLTVREEYSSNMAGPSYVVRPGASWPQPDTISPSTVNGESSFNMDKIAFSGEDQPSMNKQTYLTPSSTPMQRNDATESRQELGVVVTPQFISRNYNTDSSSIIESAQSLTSTVIVKTEPEEPHIPEQSEEISTPSIDNLSSAIPIFQSTEPMVTGDNTIKQEPLALPDNIETPDTVKTERNEMDYIHYVRGVSVDKALLSRFRNPTKLPVLTKELGELMLFLKPRMPNTLKTKRSQFQAGGPVRKAKIVTKSPPRINKTKIKSGIVKKRTKSKVKSQKTKVNNSEYKLKVLPKDMGDGSVTLTQEHKIQAAVNQASEQSQDL